MGADADLCRRFKIKKVVATAIKTIASTATYTMGDMDELLEFEIVGFCEPVFEVV